MLRENQSEKRNRLKFNPDFKSIPGWMHFCIFAIQIKNLKNYEPKS